MYVVGKVNLRYTQKNKWIDSSILIAFKCGCFSKPIYKMPRFRVYPQPSIHQISNNALSLHHPLPTYKKPRNRTFDFICVSVKFDLSLHEKNTKGTAQKTKRSLHAPRRLTYINLIETALIIIDHNNNNMPAQSKKKN